MDGEITNVHTEFGNVSNSDASDNNSFYDIQEDSQGVIHDRITDPQIAQDIAKVEASSGRDAALSYEKLLHEAFQENLTKEEMENLKVLKGIKEKYPYAVIEEVTPEGKPYIIMGNYLFGGINNPERDKHISPERRQIREQLNDFRKELSDKIVEKKSLGLEIKPHEYTIANSWTQPLGRSNEKNCHVFSVKGIFLNAEGIDHPLFGEDKTASNWSDFTSDDIGNFSKLLKLLNEHNRLLSQEYGGCQITKDFWKQYEKPSSPEDFLQRL